MRRPSRRVGLLGGMFDPIHCGHIDVAAAAERALALSDVLVMPAARPPHRPQAIASGYHRFAMAALAVAGRPGWRALDVELLRGRTTYTTETLQRLHADGYRPDELFFVTGADAFLEIATWRNYPSVLDQAHFVAVARPGTPAGDLPGRLPDLAARMILVEDGRPHRSDDEARGGGVTGAVSARACIFLIDAPTADVSSTAIRLARQARRSIAGLVPPSVQQHIEQHGLYL